MDCVRWGLCFISSRGLFSFLNFLLEGVKFCAFGCGCGRSSKFCILPYILLLNSGEIVFVLAMDFSGLQTSL